MHFYDFNIGDYAKKTQHLTNEEDIAYRRALDMYYDTEQPLPITHGLATLARRLRVGIEALKVVVEEFFPEGRNKHCDEVIANYYAFLERQKANGKKGGRPKHKDLKPSGNPLVSQNNPVPSQTLTTKPLPTNQGKTKTHVASDTGRLACPHEEILNLYHTHLPTLAAVKIWNDKRKKLLQARWREDEKRQSLEFWERFFQYVAQSDFLLGKSGQWQADLEWLLNSSNFVKVIEGKYENRKAS